MDSLAKFCLMMECAARAKICRPSIILRVKFRVRIFLTSTIILPTVKSNVLNSDSIELSQCIILEFIQSSVLEYIWLDGFVVCRADDRFA